MRPELVKTSRFLSKVLRHRPDSLGIELDSAGWVSVAELIEASNKAGRRLSLEVLQEIVETNDKKRFAFSEDGQRIRAQQGHSIEVELELEKVEPPEQLFHGTVERFAESIRAQGLIPGRRHHVHLSGDRETARQVGARRGSPFILEVAATRMQAAGFEFLRSGNGVWLVSHVPPEYIIWPTGRS